MILIIDNYDSFTYNLYQYLSELGAEVEVQRNDKVTPDEIEAMRPQGIVVSPGPCTPTEAGISQDVILRMGPHVPTLGVCLGHQCVGQAFGATVGPAGEIMHGKMSDIRHKGVGVLTGPTQSLPCHPLSLAGGPLRHPPQLPRGHCLDTERPDNGTASQGLSHPRRPVPPRVHHDHGRARSAA